MFDVVLTLLLFLTALGTGLGQTTLQFSTNIYYVTENAGSVILTVQRTGDTNAAVSVDYASANGTAIAGSDYTATSGTLTFAAGETNQTLAVPILNDGLVEPAIYETFTVTLSNPTNAILGTRTVATGRITDNDKGLVDRPTVPVQPLLFVLFRELLAVNLV